MNTYENALFSAAADAEHPTAVPPSSDGLIPQETGALTLAADADGDTDATTTSTTDDETGGDLAAPAVTALATGIVKPAPESVTAAPANDLRDQAAILRHAGHCAAAAQLEHAAAELEKRDAEIALKDRELTARKAKAARKAKIEQRRIAHDPEMDTKYDRIAAKPTWFETVSFMIGLLFLDTGPSDEPGGVLTPAGLFARWTRREALRHPDVQLTSAFVDAITERIEKKVDDRFLTLKSILSRVANRRHWLDLVDAHQLSGAHERIAAQKWLDVYIEASVEPDAADAPVIEHWGDGDPSNANRGVV